MNKKWSYLKYLFLFTIYPIQLTVNQLLRQQSSITNFVDKQNGSKISPEQNLTFAKYQLL